MKTKEKMNKKSIIISCCLLILTVSLSAQTNKKKIIQDTIFVLGGRTIICFVQKVNPLGVDYKFLNDPNVYSIDKKQIQKIVYRTGMIETYNKPIFIEVEETSWEAVLVTDKRDDIRGMYKYGDVEAASSPGAMSKKKAVQTATIKLQKKAANLKGNIVLVTKTEPRGGYGEPPSYVLKGEVYGYNPPPVDETNDHKEVINEIIK